MSFSAQVLKGYTPIEELEKEWINLFKRSESHNPFLSSEWVFTWLKHAGPQIFPVTLIIRDESNKLVATWPFFEYPAIGGKGLWSGLADRAYILNPLFVRKDPDLIMTMLLQLENLLTEYRFVWVPLFTDSFVRDWLKPALNQFPNLVIIQPRVPAPFIDLQQHDNFDCYLNTVLGSKTRKSVRYDAKQLEKLGDLEYVVYRSEEDYYRIETEMRTIEKVSWKSESKVSLLSNRATGAFFHELLPKLLAEGQAEISAMRLNQMAIAFEIAIRRDTYYGFFHIAYLPDYQKHSPGKQLMLFNIKRAKEEGCTEFDFMQGGHKYKQKFCTGTREMVDVFLCQRSFAGQLNYGLSRIARLIRKKRP